MERYKFEDLISDYIENKLPVAKRKEVEAFMEDNPQAKAQMESIQSLINGSIPIDPSLLGSLP